MIFRTMQAKMRHYLLNEQDPNVAVECNCLLMSKVQDCGCQIYVSHYSTAITRLRPVNKIADGCTEYFLFFYNYDFCFS